MRFPIRPIIALVALLAISSAVAQQQQPAQPANFDVRMSVALRNDLAGTLIKMQQLAACDLPCHIIISRTLIALESASPVAAAEGEPKKE